MTTHSSILAWKIPCSEVPADLQSMRMQESDMTEHTHTHTHTHRQKCIFQNLEFALIRNFPSDSCLLKMLKNY